MQRLTALVIMSGCIFLYVTSPASSNRALFASLQAIRTITIGVLKSNSGRCNGTESKSASR